MNKRNEDDTRQEKLKFSDSPSREAPASPIVRDTKSRKVVSLSDKVLERHRAYVIEQLEKLGL